MGCGKKYDDAKKRDLHRSNSVPCRQKYNDYLINLPSAFDRVDQPPSPTNAHPPPIEPVIAAQDGRGPDVDMVDVMYDGLEEMGDSDMVDGNEGGISQIPAVEARIMMEDTAEVTDDDAEDDEHNPDEEESDHISNSGSDGGADSDAQSDIGQGTWQGFQPGMEEPASEPDDYTDLFPEAGRVVSRGQPCGFSKILDEKKARRDQNLYFPFANKMEWELVAWIHRTGISTSEINQFIKLQYVSPLLRGARTQLT
jgi:hypothetical protein